jgi:hypothetical protein
MTSIELDPLPLHPCIASQKKVTIVLCSGWVEAECAQEVMRRERERESQQRTASNTVNKERK